MVDFHLTISAPRRSAKRWGDWAYAHALADALRGRGHSAHIHCLFELTHRDQIGADAVVLRIAGPHLEDAVDSALNMAWIISNPVPCFPRVLAGYQHLFAAGQELTDSWQRLGLDSNFLPQATDPDRFNPGLRHSNLREDILFVGGYDPVRVQRRLVFDAIEMGFPVAVWGPGWEGKIPAGNHRGRHLEADALAQAYASARIVLNAHMEDQRATGIMSNRTMDALAAGAAVVSDQVIGAAEALNLPGLHICADHDSLHSTLTTLLDGPEPGLRKRQAQHRDICARYSFASAAQQIETRALAIQAIGARADLRPRLISDLPPGDHNTPRNVLVADMAGQISALHAAGAPGYLLTGAENAAAPPDDGWLLIEDLTLIPPLVKNQLGPVHIHLLLSEARATPPAQADPYLAPHAIIDTLHRIDLVTRCAGESVTLTTYHSGQAPPDQAEALARLAPPPDMPLHPLIPLRHKICTSLINGDSNSVTEDFQLIDMLWRRLSIMALCLMPAARSIPGPELLLRLMQGLPIFPSGPDQRPAKWLTHPVRLDPVPSEWPALDRPIGVFLHLFYDELAPFFAERLAALELPHRIYISTDSAKKAGRIRTHFPQAEIRVFENRGRDVWPRLWGFADAHDNHDIVLHLHGKRSRHSGRLDGWLRHNLDNLIGDAGCARSILTILHDLPQIGVVAPPIYPGVRASVHWTINRPFAEMLAPDLGLIALPDNADLVFPVGSMFWARSDALKPLTRLGLKQQDFAPERGQVDGTLAHAIERLVSMTAANRGFGHLCYDAAGSDKTRLLKDTAHLARFLRRRAARKGG